MIRLRKNEKKIKNIVDKNEQREERKGGGREKGGLIDKGLLAFPTRLLLPSLSHPFPFTFHIRFCPSVRLPVGSSESLFQFPPAPVRVRARACVRASSCRGFWGRGRRGGRSFRGPIQGTANALGLGEFNRGILVSRR